MDLREISPYYLNMKAPITNFLKAVGLIKIYGKLAETGELFPILCCEEGIDGKGVLNKIVKIGKQSMLAGLYTTSSTVNPIASLRLGTGGCVDPEGKYPKVVDDTLTNLYTYALTLPVIHTVDSTVPSVTFIADLDTALGNGVNINEMGMFLQSGEMFNIKTFPSIPKTDAFSLHVEWTIKLL